MSHWITDELETTGDAEELRLASSRSDGTLRPYVTLWVVRARDDLYVRSVCGPDTPWYRRARASGGRIRAGGLERDVAFAGDTPHAHGDIGAACHASCDRCGAR